MLEGRKHARSRERFLVQISSVYDSRLAGLASVEDISSRGTRVTTERSWEAGSQVELKSPSSGSTWARARVVYCRAVSAKEFAVGLDLLTQTNDWPKPSEPPASSHK